MQPWPCHLVNIFVKSGKRFSTKRRGALMTTSPGLLLEELDLLGDDGQLASGAGSSELVEEEEAHLESGME
jgi:hypothetical protein